MTTQAPEKSLPPAKPATKPKEKAVKAAPSTVVSVLALIFFEILLPTVIAAGVVWALFYFFDIWKSEPSLANLLFGAAIVAIALVITLVVDTPLTIIHRGYRKQGVRMGSSPLARLIRIVLAGLVLPIGVVAALYYAPIPGPGTAYNWLVTASVKPAVTAPPQEVANLAIQSKDPYTKILSIQVLQGFHSSDALNELIRMVNDDRSALNSAMVRNQLAKAIASYGTDAKEPLLNLFKAIDPAASGQGAPLSGGLYDQYFSSAFDSLKSEINTNTTDPGAREAKLAQLNAAQTMLKANLDSIQDTATPQYTSSADPRLDFIIQTLLSMNISDDADILSFAKATAADGRYSNVVRGDALLLIAKMGTKDDLDGLFPYLQNSDALIQTRALQAIAGLQAKVNGASTSSGNQ